MPTTPACRNRPVPVCESQEVRKTEATPPVTLLRLLWRAASLLAVAAVVQTGSIVGLSRAGSSGWARAWKGKETDDYRDGP